MALERQPESAPIVTLNIFSGLPNPSWQLSHSQVDELARRLPAAPVAIAGKAYDVWSFYAGFTIEGLDDQGDITIFGGEITRERDGVDLVVARDSDRELERWLYESTMPADLRASLGDRTFATLTVPRDERQPIYGIAGGAAGGLACETAPRYSGTSGEWKRRRKRNNCYNYANNEPSRGLLPAVPGGDVNPDHTVDSMRAAVESDDIEYVGTSMPAACPTVADAHFMVVCLREKYGGYRDFHCLRLDRNGHWSHKDGNSKVFDTDNAGQLLVDLQTSLWKWRMELVGFFLSIEARRRLKH